MPCTCLFCLQLCYIYQGLICQALSWLIQCNVKNNISSFVLVYPQQSPIGGRHIDRPVRCHRLLRLQIVIFSSHYICFVAYQGDEVAVTKQPTKHRRRCMDKRERRKGFICIKRTSLDNCGNLFYSAQQFIKPGMFDLQHCWLTFVVFYCCFWLPVSCIHVNWLKNCCFEFILIFS